MGFGLRRQTKRPSGMLQRSSNLHFDDASGPSRYSLVPTSDLPCERLPWGMGHIKLLPQKVLSAPGGPFSQPYVATASHFSHETGATFEHEILDPISFHSALPSLSRLESDNRARKKELQWVRWMGEIIPALLPLYLKLLRETDSLRSSPNGGRIFYSPCQCQSPQSISVTCIYFKGITEEKVCLCSAAATLLLRGLFPCAPRMPSLAIDLNVLEFTKELFVRMAPNVTAWCETLEAFLGNKMFSLDKDGMRRRFTNAIHWYHILTIRKDMAVRSAIDCARHSSDAVDSGDMDVEYDINSQDMFDIEDKDQIHVAITRPSDYLRSKCPLCFGGKNWHNDEFEADVIVCLDACFTQKRRRNPKSDERGPVDLHPDSVFLPEEQVKAMEVFVESFQQKGKTNSGANTEADADGYEPAMVVPKSVLDGCKSSFSAANERKSKAKTQFFADTGLMALLCRHDRILWLVNMTSAGEKQFYALALINELFKHIPLAMTVGILYDIGCQLHRSCAKWDFLGPNLDRIIWSVSVFHAFGHQWPCQLIYHPQKTRGFGLSDGEGCERLWSSIKLLIPSMRMSGYYQRLFTIDNQMQFLNRRSLFTLGSWLAKKWSNCLDKKKKAEKILHSLNLSENLLRGEWEKQVKEQTKPASKSQQVEKEVLKDIIELINAKELVKQEHSLLVDMLESKQFKEGMDVEDTLAMMRKLVKKSLSLSAQIHTKSSALGTSGKDGLQKLQKSLFLQLHVKALTLKKQIRSELQARQFELNSTGKDYASIASNDKKLYNNLLSQVKRRQSSITKLATRYNNLCDEIAVEVQKTPTFKKVIFPIKLQKNQLFSLDVDSEIWQDIDILSYTEETETSWANDSDVKDGIKAMLQFDRCVEEEKRIALERSAMQDWFTEEWTCVNKALDKADSNMLYQLQFHKRFLCKLYTEWSTGTQIIPPLFHMAETWGPTESDLIGPSDYAYDISKFGNNGDDSSSSETDENDYENDDSDSYTMEAYSEEDNDNDEMEWDVNSL